MKKKVLAVLLATLMSATMFAGMAIVTADEKECFDKGAVEWVNIYKMSDKELKELQNSKSTDLQIYAIDVGHLIGTNYFRVKYKLYVTSTFTDTFDDRLWIDDYIIEDHEHDNEYMWVGQNGPYYSTWFNTPGYEKGYFDIKVHTDFGEDVDEVDDDNNDDTEEHYFWWLG